MKAFRINWKDGTSVDIKGNTIEEAFATAGYNEDHHDLIECYDDFGNLNSYNCSDCNTEFFLTDTQEKWYQGMNFPLPKRCPSCRERRKDENNIQNKMNIIYSTRDQQVNHKNLFLDLMKDLEAYIIKYGQSYSKGERFIQTKFIKHQNDEPTTTKPKRTQNNRVPSVPVQ